MACRIVYDTTRVEHTIILIQLLIWIIAIPNFHLISFHFIRRRVIESVHISLGLKIPVIIATQMMETMISSLTPTRAEVNDVANSVMDGADAVMLSGETSVGSYPVQVIEKMSSIIRSVEDSDLISVPQNPPHIKTKRYITKSICYHAANMANEIDAKAISTLTNVWKHSAMR